MSYQLMFQKAVELQQNGALNEAEQIYRQILETAPGNADVLNLLGLIAQSRGIHAEATGYFYKAAESAPKHFPVYFNLAVSLGALGRYVEAEEAYAKVLELKPDCKEAYLGEGNLYWAQGKKDEAAEAFRKALEIDPSYTEAETNLAELTDGTGTLRNISEGNVRALYYLGRRAFNKRDFAAAADYLDKADKLAADDEIKSMLGEALQAEGRKSEALQKFYQALQLNPHNLAALLNIADAEAENGNFKTAEGFYKRALEVDAKNLRAHTNYANMLCRCKRTLEALEEYRQAVLVSPQSPELSYNLSQILKTLGEYEQALDLMFNAFYLDTSRTEISLNIYETLAEFYAKEPEKAKKICENWYAKMPENSVVRHLHAALNGVPDADGSEYIRTLFDNFAPTYEDTMKNINYAAADKIAEICDPLKGKVLDLGCGTGILGEKIKNNENELTGVDISAKMLEKAAGKNIYAKLVNADIAEYLKGGAAGFDCVVASDVLCYSGDLSALFSEVFPVCFIFSVETDANCGTFVLRPDGRYKHNPVYVKELLQKVGYKNITETPLVLRKENGADVQGSVFEAKN